MLSFNLIPGKSGSVFPLIKYSEIFSITYEKLLLYFFSILYSFWFNLITLFLQFQLLLITILHLDPLIVVDCPKLDLKEQPILDF